MEPWKKDARREGVITDLDAPVPQNYLLRKIEKVMDYEWLYERLPPYYCHDNRDLAAVTRWVRLKYAAMNLKKLAVWSWKDLIFANYIMLFFPNYGKAPVFA